MLAKMNVPANAVRLVAATVGAGHGDGKEDIHEPE